jgi:hypothetical protein
MRNRLGSEKGQAAGLHQDDDCPTTIPAWEETEDNVGDEDRWSSLELRVMYKDRKGIHRTSLY